MLAYPDVEVFEIAGLDATPPCQSASRDAPHSPEPAHEAHWLMQMPCCTILVCQQRYDWYHSPLRTDSIQVNCSKCGTRHEGHDFGWVRL